MELPRSAVAWIGFIVGISVLTTADGIHAGISDSETPWGGLILFTALAILTDVFPVRLTRFRISITVSTVIDFGAALAFGPPAVVLALGSLVADLILRRRLSRVLFNAAMLSIAIWCSAAVWNWPGQRAVVSEGPPLQLNSSALAWIAAGFVFILTNAVAVVTVVALTDRASLLNVIRGSLSTIAVQLLTLPTIGWMVAVLYDHQPLSLVIITFPLVALYYSLRSVEQIRRQTLETIEKLSDVIDRRDPATEQHSQRVARYAGMICEQLALPADFAEITVSAARVHDLGKVAVPDAILFKAGKLSDEEWTVVKRHPVEGAELLDSIETYRMGTRLIRHHHERWDGRGYPDGLAGEDIPLGARIIAVADAFDVMTSVRTYSRPVDTVTALDELSRKAGTQFDPEIVAAFRAVMGSGRTGAELERAHPKPSGV